MAKMNCNFISYTLKRAVDITVIIPSTTIPESLGFDNKTPNHQIKEAFPVVYLLHGYGNNHVTWTGYTNIELYAEERNIAVVMISAENKAYVNHEYGESFFTFLSEELPQFVSSMFPVSSHPDNTYMAGLSMGGYGSLIHGLTNPGGFKAIGAFSAAISLNPNTLFGGKDQPVAEKYQPHHLLENTKESSLESLPIYLSCGEKDFLIEENLTFMKALISKGFHVTWKTHPDYGHEWRFWDQEVEAFLDWIPRTDYYASLPMRKV